MKVTVKQSELTEMVQRTVRRVLSESKQEKTTAEVVLPKQPIKVKLSELREVIKQVIKEEYEKSPYPEDKEFDSDSYYEPGVDVTKDNELTEGFDELIPVGLGTVGVFLASAGITEVMSALENGKLGPKGQKLAKFLEDFSRTANHKEVRPPRNMQNPTESIDEEGKPSAGLSKTQKSNIATKARHGEDIGKPGKGFDTVAKKAAQEYGSKEAGERVAAAAMWKNAGK